MVALVQTALMMPVMLVSIAAGAIADMYDRRKVILAALAVSLSSATLLSVLTFAGLLTPNVLLVLCFLIGTGMALFGPRSEEHTSELQSLMRITDAVFCFKKKIQIKR